MINFSLYSYLAECAEIAPAIIFSFTVHEYAHALVATLSGDSTPEEDGRLTLNPLAHIDLLGFIMVFVSFIGWARPVRFNKLNLRHPKIQTILIAIAGPLANLLSAILILFIMKYLHYIQIKNFITLTLFQLLSTTAMLNITLCIFNLLPIPPLDGGHLVTSLIEDVYPEFAELIRRYSFIFFIALILFFPNMFSIVHVGARSLYKLLISSIF